MSAGDHHAEQVVEVEQRRRAVAPADVLALHLARRRAASRPHRMLASHACRIVPQSRHDHGCGVPGTARVAPARRRRAARRRAARRWRLRSTRRARAGWTARRRRACAGRTGTARWASPSARPSPGPSGRTPSAGRSARSPRPEGRSARSTCPSAASPASPAKGRRWSDTRPHGSTGRRRTWMKKGFSARIARCADARVKLPRKSPWWMPVITWIVSCGSTEGSLASTAHAEAL